MTQPAFTWTNLNWTLIHKPKKKKDKRVVFIGSIKCCHPYIGRKEIKGGGKEIWQKCTKFSIFWLSLSLSLSMLCLSIPFGSCKLSFPVLIAPVTAPLLIP